jgi:hypothetical protein
MQPSGSVFGSLEAIDDLGQLMELSLLYGHVNADNILPYDTPRSDVQMSFRSNVSLDAAQDQMKI